MNTPLAIEMNDLKKWEPFLYTSDLRKCTGNIVFSSYLIPTLSTGSADQKAADSVPCTDQMTCTSHSVDSEVEIPM